jgi:hypothetical protein
MRLGSDEHKKPIWATFPAVIHRPLPPDARIMSATITRRRLGVFHSSGRYSYTPGSNLTNSNASSPTGDLE